MKVAATPIRAIDSTRPNTMIHGWSCAAPATARTLSRLMVMSAIMIWSSAAPKVLRLMPMDSGVAPPPWCAASAASISSEDSA